MALSTDKLLMNSYLPDREQFDKMMAQIDVSTDVETQIGCSSFLEVGSASLPTLVKQ